MESGELQCHQISDDFKNKPCGDTTELPAGPVPNVHEKKHELKGQQLPFEVINGMPMFQNNHVIANRYQIFERIGWDDRVGATYLAIAPDGKELVLRIGNDQILIPQLEASFLCKIEQQNLWRYFSQVHSIYQEEKFYYLALYFRSGPILRECLQYSGKKFTHGEKGMEGVQMASESDTLLQDTSKIDTHNHELVMPHWCGGLLFAPMTFHDDDAISCRDELEAWLYFFVYLVKGTVPWENDRAEDVKWTKIKSINCGDLFEGLPHQYKKILDTITREGSSDPVSSTEYDRLEELTKEIIHDVGGIKDDDDNFDFERDPTEDEIPR
ncbi:hypothetical protein OSTOST_18223 [Ostertagia ostertagi]